MGLPSASTEGPLNTQNWLYLASYFIVGKGNPEGVVRARVGAIYLREDGEPGDAVYVKESGEGTDEGWSSLEGSKGGGFATVAELLDEAKARDAADDAEASAREVHEGKATTVHGIADTSKLATRAEVESEKAERESKDAERIVGPGSASSGNLPSYEGTTGKKVKDSGAAVANVPSTDQKAALAGSAGTPSDANRYLTETDPKVAIIEVALPDALLSLKPNLYWNLGSVEGLNDLGSSGKDGEAKEGLVIGGATSLTSDGGKATNFDGANDRIDSTFALSGDHTLVGWAWRDTSATTDTLFSDNASASLRIEPNKNVVFQAFEGVAGWQNAWPGNERVVSWALQPEWGSGATLYINGVSKGRSPFVGTAEPFSGNLRVGADKSGASPFDGKMSHFAVWNERLTPASILWLTSVGFGRQPYRDWGLQTVLPQTGLCIVGDRCTFAANAASGVFWDLIFDGEGSLPWKKLGGPPLVASSNTERTLNSKTSYEPLPTDPLSIVTPLTGDYDITISSVIAANAGQLGAISYAVGATAASDTWCQAGSEGAFDGFKVTRHLNVPKSVSIAEKARTGGAYPIIFNRRRLLIDPVRVG